VASVKGEAASRPPLGVRRRPTIQDIANEAGVSKGLVSMVLTGAPGPSAATRQKVVAVADRLGYRTNRTAALLARRRTRLLGVTSIPSSSYHGELVEEIQIAAEAAGYEIVLSSISGSRDEDSSIETLVGFRCEALLLLGPARPDDLLAPIIDSVPTVVLGRPVNLPDVDVVRADDRQGIGGVVDHLVSLGHSRIAHVDGGAGLISLERRQAYRQAAERHGIPDLVLPGGVTELDGAFALDELPAGSGVTAVVAFNDRTAVGVMDRLERAGRSVPGQVSVTGFDDSLVARHARIDLTSVSQEHLEQARLAVRLALERLDGGRTERREIVLPARLVARGSTAPHPGPEPRHRGRQ
jgi:DNA-binding LacI/PurR family transcriptional regulator